MKEITEADRESALYRACELFCNLTYDEFGKLLRKVNEEEKNGRVA